MKVRKKLIEVAMPLDAINQASAREKSIRHGHPSTLHLWWARRPLAAARAVIFAQMVDDPSAVPELFPTVEAQDAERQRLFRIIEDMVAWESSTKEDILEPAREEIWKSWRRACADNSDHPQAAELFNPEKLPIFHDPFAGGGTLPLEAQRLGFKAYATDLNPVAVLINKATIEIPPQFDGRPPISRDSLANQGLVSRRWTGAEGLVEDLLHYGKWMRAEALKRIGHLYPEVRVTEEIVTERPALRALLGKNLTVIAWIWARTVRSPDPAHHDKWVPLISSFWLCKKKGREAWVQPEVDYSSGNWRLHVRASTPPGNAGIDEGTKTGRGNFRCLLSKAAIPVEYIRAEAQAGQVKFRLIATVVDGGRLGRIYLPATPDQEHSAECTIDDPPDTELPVQALGFRVQNYGLKLHRDLFTNRQLNSLTTFCSLVDVARQKVLKDGGSEEYAKALAVLLAMGVSRRQDRWSNLSIWNTIGEKIETFIRLNAVPMTWEFAEANPFSTSTGNWLDGLELTAKALLWLPRRPAFKGKASQSDALNPGAPPEEHLLICTDPPYYDNIPYAALSDFFYIWQRRALRSVLPELYSTVLVPKSSELIADQHRHPTRESAENFFVEGTAKALRHLRNKAHPALPIAIFYAFKQTETNREGMSSTGWETFLSGVLSQDLRIVGTWPMKTERAGGLRNQERNSLISSILLVCRSREVDAPAATQREFLSQLKRELPAALQHLREGQIALVDLQQASLGPGMDVFSRYSKVIGANGQPMTVREALLAINQTLDELVAENEGELDRESQWAVAWFNHASFADGDFGVAENLCKAKNTSVTGMEKSGLIAARAGKVRLLKPDELSAKWDPTNPKVSEWEILHQLIRVHSSQAESAVADLVRKLSGRADFVPDLCLSLHRTCELKKRATEAAWYNALGQSWHEICRLAQSDSAAPVQQSLEL